MVLRQITLLAGKQSVPEEPPRTSAMLEASRVRPPSKLTEWEDPPSTSNLSSGLKKLRKAIGTTSHSPSREKKELKPLACG